MKKACMMELANFAAVEDGKWPKEVMILNLGGISTKSLNCYSKMLRYHRNLNHGLQNAPSQLVYWEPEGHQRALQPLMARRPLGPFSVLSALGIIAQ